MSVTTSPAPPVIDVSPLFTSPLTSAPSPASQAVARAIHSACLTDGFFQVINTNIPPSLIKSLHESLARFFDLPLSQKTAISVQNGGHAWRGYMPYGGEGTKGRTDQKEGIYCGPEHPDEHEHSGLPTFGRNQFPDEQLPEMRGLVLEYIAKVTELGLVLSDAISYALGLDPVYVRREYLEPEPVQLFRAFKYTGKDVVDASESPGYGIGPHSDFGFLTILGQFGPGLQMQNSKGEWVDVPVIDNGFSCNVGDILDRFTDGRYKSMRHRVLPPAGGSTRISVPFFFDPAWTARIRAFPLSHLPPLSETEREAATKRWEENTTFTKLDGVWADYLAKKVQKIFPDLPLPDFDGNKAASTRFALAVPTGGGGLTAANGQQ